MKPHPMMRILALLAMSPLVNVGGFSGTVGIAHAQNVVPQQERTVQKNSTDQSLSTSRQQTNTTVPEEEKKRPKPTLFKKEPKPEMVSPPHYPSWPHRSTTIIREESQPSVIIINNPPAEPQPPPKPDPQYLWVPPVVEKRTEPGHWEYGVQKIWMGDHWRYEQDETAKIWVPEKEVDYVQQPGYWDVVE